MKTMKKLTFLGTGHGMPIASTTSCIFLEDGRNNLLLDAGGGHDVLGKFHAAGIDINSIKNVLITHYDSDHILGIVPLVRAFHKHLHTKEKRTLFCSQEVKNAVDSLFQHTAKRHYDDVKNILEFVIIRDRMEYTLNNWKITFFDIRSNKSPQFGCKIAFADKKCLVFPGDEPI